MHKRALALLIVLVPAAALSVACGAGFGEQEVDPCTLAMCEAPPPPPIDASVDAKPDVAPDVGADATPDATPDATRDAAPDATPDAAPDAAPDPCDGVVCDAPNGTFACQAGKCVTVKCDDGFGDCDSDPTNGCEPLTTYYVDNDGDGHGDIAGPTQACTLPAGYSDVSDDCHDGDARAFPGQTAYFDTPRPDGSFDFSCDASEEKQYPRVDPRYCGCAWGRCGVSLGWKDAVPACGESGLFVKSEPVRFNCDLEYEMRVQTCR